jgi:protein-tyrosine phosphatase
LDLSGFKAHKLNSQAILSSDLIFVMEDAQRDHILKVEPKAEGKIFSLKKFLPFQLEKDIPDPIGKSIFVYEEVYSLIKEAVLELKNWL